MAATTAPTCAPPGRSCAGSTPRGSSAPTSRCGPLSDIPASYSELDVLGVSEYIGWYGGRLLRAAGRPRRAARQTPAARPARDRVRRRGQPLRAPRPEKGTVRVPGALPRRAPRCVRRRAASWTGRSCGRCATSPAGRGGAGATHSHGRPRTRRASSTATVQRSPRWRSSKARFDAVPSTRAPLRRKLMFVWAVAVADAMDVVQAATSGDSLVKDMRPGRREGSPRFSRSCRFCRSRDGGHAGPRGPQGPLEIHRAAHGTLGVRRSRSLRSYELPAAELLRPHGTAGRRRAVLGFRLQAAICSLPERAVGGTLLLAVTTGFTGWSCRGATGLPQGTRPVKDVRIRPCLIRPSQHQGGGSPALLRCQRWKAQLRAVDE